LAPVFPTQPHNRNQSIATQWLHTFGATKINLIEVDHDRPLRCS
jgi:hypothetical protein